MWTVKRSVDDLFFVWKYGTTWCLCFEFEAHC